MYLRWPYVLNLCDRTLILYINFFFDITIQLYTWRSTKKRREIKWDFVVRTIEYTEKPAPFPVVY